jgi:phosphoribosylformimino-5-aminoimidazole carboxamide ribotide isomerase
MDLMGGQVVRAKRGERQSYKPIASPLCNSSEPLAVAHALVELYPFNTLYMADLDAIQHCGNHLKIVESLRSAFPNMEIWIDAGFSSFEACEPWLMPGIHCVVGSESQSDAESTWRLIEQLGSERAVLSLDFANNQYQGPAALFDNANDWPQRVIAMTLARIGSYAGPDVALLQTLQRRANGRKIFAAGGIRNIRDMEKLKTMGVAGALMASALHDGKVMPDQIAKLGK